MLAGIGEGPFLDRQAGQAELRVHEVLVNFDGALACFPRGARIFFRQRQRAQRRVRAGILGIKLDSFLKLLFRVAGALLLHFTNAALIGFARRRGDAQGPHRGERRRRGWFAALGSRAHDDAHRKVAFAIVVHANRLRLEAGGVRQL